MTASDKRKAQVLVVLLLTAAGTWYFVARPNIAPAARTPAAKAQGKQSQQAVPDAQIRLGLLEDSSAASNVGRKNIFQYRQKPAPPRPPETFKPSTPIVTDTRPPIVATPSVPLPPPFKAFRYEGYSSKAGRMIASLSEGGNTYQVTEGECLMGQYCIRKLTETTVEIEDLQLKRRQSFARVQQ
jgi:hypothetical protein